MSTATTVTVPAGWYADPLETAAGHAATRRRWWNGSQWTDHTASIVTSAPATTSALESALVAHSMPLHTVDTSSSLPAYRAAPTRSTASPLSAVTAETSGYEPFALRDRVAHPTAQHTTGHPVPGLRVTTLSAWLIATMPITQAALIFGVFSSLPAESSAWTRALAVIFPLILCGALAMQDRQQLEASGHLRTAPSLLAIAAPPVFLALRAVFVNRTTNARPWPLLIWLLSQVSVLGVWYLLDSATMVAVLGALLS